MIKEKIKKGYIDKNGKHYPNIIDYHFVKGEGLKLGKFITSSHDDDVDAYGVGDGVYIYQDLDNPKIGYRISRDFNDGISNNLRDAEFIEKLRERGKNVSLTTFTYGIVTLDNRVIGQIIPFYDKAETLRHFVRENGWDQLKLYQECAEILKELCANGIYYYDMNPDNFVLTNEGIKLIDFDSQLISFDEAFSIKQERVLENFKTMLFILSNGKLKEELPMLLEVSSFDEIINSLNKGKEK